VIIKTGWQNDFGKLKFDIELNEIDLARILYDANIPPDASLTSTESFGLLLLEAERFSEGVRAQRLQDGAAANAVAKALADRHGLLTKIKVRLGLEQRAAA
jgi:hypothetical protein